jgi:hypothetical protein
MLFFSLQISPSRNHWSVGPKTFFRNQQGRNYSENKKKIIKKLQKKISSFLVLFPKLWESGESAALRLNQNKVLFSDLLIMSFKNHYRSEFFDTFACQTDRQAVFLSDRQTDRQACLRREIKLSYEKEN